MRVLIITALFLNLLFSSITLELKEGWNLTGLPANSSIESIKSFDKSILKILFYENGKWLDSGTPKANSGVWIKALNKTTLNLSSTRSKSEIDIIEIKEGWNLLSITTPYNIHPRVFESFGTIWRYESGEWRQYDSNNKSLKEIKPFEGFWLKSDKNESFDLAKSSSELQRFGSNEELEEYLLKMSKEYNFYQPVYILDTQPLESVTESENSVEDATSTNLQVSGVDEADIIKHDSNHIFYIKSNEKKLFITKFNEDLDTKTDPITLNLDKTPNALFLQNNRLVIIYPNSSDFWSIWQTPQSEIWQRESLVEIYDVSDIKSIKKIASYKIDGEIVDSRIANEKLYIISRFMPSNEKLKPVLKDNIQNKKIDIVDFTNLYAPSKLNQAPYITSILEFDLQGELIDKINYVGSSNTMMATTKSIYFISDTYPVYYSFIDFEKRSRVYKFSIKEALEYKGSTFIDGSVINQFCLSEKDDVLRVATTSGSSWRDDTNNLLYLIKEDENSLKVISKLENLGLKGESLKSVRFVGDSAFLVTFKQTDPLYSIDLSDIYNPKVLGELKIEGFSTYFHPVSEDLILSIGRDADSSGRVLGVQVELFDIKDLKNPKLLDKIKIGDSSTYAEALYNHKAFTFRQSDNLFSFAIGESYSGINSNYFMVYKVEDEKIKEIDKIDQSSSKSIFNSRSIIFDKDSNSYILCFIDGDFTIKTILE
jgi:uncharacterized secreted protein with C-terminal beta-propeller domain